MNARKNLGTLTAVTAAASLLVGLAAGLWLQYRDALVILEVTVVSEHDDRFHFYSDHGSGWVSDEWSRPLKAGVPTKLYMKFHKAGIKRFKFEPLRNPGTIRFDSVLFTDHLDAPLRPFPIDKIKPQKNISLESETGQLPLLFRVPSGAQEPQDPQIYVTETKEWKFSSRRDLWNRRLPLRSLRIALVSFLLLTPIALTAYRTSPSTP